MSEGAAIVDLSRKIDELALERARRVARFEAAREYAEHGYPNAVAFLKGRCNLSASAAMEVVSVSRTLPVLSRVESAVEQGQIGFEHAAVIAESVQRVSAVAEVQDGLLARAAEVDPSQLRQVARRVEMEVDADRARQNEEALYRSRRLFVQRLGDGRFRIEGVLDGEGGVVLRTALGAAMGARSSAELRTEQQRRADALVEVARRALDGRRFGQSGRQAPHVQMTVDPKTGEGEIQGLGPVSGQTIERLLCDCALSVNGSPEVRTFNGSKRRALAMKLAHCHFPGCDRPVDWCDGHHIQRWSEKGQTVPENGALVCGFHHRLLHEGGWRLAREGDGYVALSPHGEMFRSAKSPPAAA